VRSLRRPKGSRPLESLLGGSTVEEADKGTWVALRQTHDTHGCRCRLVGGGPGRGVRSENFDQREAVRTRLRQELLLVAIVPDVYVWALNPQPPTLRWTMSLIMAERAAVMAFSAAAA